MSEGFLNKSWILPPHPPHIAFGPMLAALICGADLFPCRPTVGSVKCFICLIEAVEGDAEVATVAIVFAVGPVEVLGRDGLVELEHEVGSTPLEPFLWFGCPFLLAAHPEVTFKQFGRCNTIGRHAGGDDVVCDEVPDRVALGEQAVDSGSLFLCYRKGPALFQFTL